jgi:hypothetical protein
VNADASELAELLSRLKALRRELKLHEPALVSKMSIRNEARALGAEWFQDFAPKLKAALPKEILDRYSAQFTRLIKLSNPSNRKTSYLGSLEALIKPFEGDLLIPAQQGGLSTESPSHFDAFFADLSIGTESDYLAEAINCAKSGYLRAAAVLGWSAAIDRVHRVVQDHGFGKFNAMSAQMAAATVGRYKKFNKAQNVTSLAELREVFDTTILWIIEGMGLIDTNQHTRLISCFDMRCHGAHPGDAPITTYNLMSFFSDLDQIIFANSNFQLSANLGS